MLTNNYPIQLFTERVIINSEQELIKLIDEYNCKKTIYYSLYSPTKKLTSNQCCNQQQDSYHFCNTKIDKICFDIDNLNSLEVIRKFHIYCLKNNLKHLLLFSGSKGFHVYIFTKNYNNLKNTKTSLTNAHNYFIRELNLKVNGNGNSDVDSHILGDISRLMRFPNTLHMDSKLYSIPLQTEDIVLGKSHIMKKAEKQCFKFIYYGEELLDMKQFDNKFIEVQKIPENNMYNVEVSIDKKKVLDDFPPCLQNILTQPYIYWRPRFHIIKYLQHVGYSEAEINLIIKNFTEGKKHPQKLHDNFQHYLKERQFIYVKKNNALFSCQKVKQDGLCPVQGLCKKIQEKPLYL